MDAQPLPRNVIPKKLASGRTGYYFNVPTYYRDLGCPVGNEPLGTNYTVACGDDGEGGRAAALNGRFDEWLAVRNGEPVEGVARYGTVDWLFREYKASRAYLDKVSVRSALERALNQGHDLDFDLAQAGLQQPIVIRSSHGQRPFSNPPMTPVYSQVEHPSKSVQASPSASVRERPLGLGHPRQYAKGP